MKRPLAPVIVTLAALALCAGAAAAQAVAPLSVAHRGPITGKPNALFNQIKASFSSGRFGPYTIVGAYPASHTLVVKRSNINSMNWSRWAYCKMGPMDLLDVLRDGSVTMTIHLEPTTKWITWAVVKAEFTGTYQLGSQVKQTQCMSTGVLEENMLRRFGANVP
jgi:hypothetical protein